MDPFVEEVATADKAISNFYYPPIGNRSWGGEFRFRERPPADRLQYPQSWNANRLLGFQLRRSAERSTPGISSSRHRLDLMGPVDIAFDLERHSNSHSKR